MSLDGSDKGFLGKTFEKALRALDNNTDLYKLSDMFMTRAVPISLGTGVVSALLFAAFASASLSTGNPPGIATYASMTIAIGSHLATCGSFAIGIACNLLGAAARQLSLPDEVKHQVIKDEVSKRQSPYDRDLAYLKRRRIVDNDIYQYPLT